MKVGITAQLNWMCPNGKNKGARVVKNQLNQKQLLSAQRNEISEYHTYKWLASRIRNDRNRKVLDRIAKEELGHYEVLRRLTKTDVQPQKLRVLRYQMIARVFGLTFGLRLMERGEEIAEKLYRNLEGEFPELGALFKDEHRHEAEILGLIEEERIEYAGSIVLGLNDALMELTGALAGLTLALQNGQIIAMTGFIIGVAASMSMAASEFLSSREEADKNTSKSPLKSAVYTGIAYIVTVLVLISPYLLLSNVYASAVVMMVLSILIILSYNFYITTAKGLRLWRRFGEMAAISLGVACISFFIGMIARMLFGVEL
jgi:VIT1/CCC1 family predicted Fe2+/Mn2+ transporter